MEEPEQDRDRQDEARRMLAELDARIAVNRARLEAAAGRRKSSRVLGIVMLVLFMLLMVWMLFWLSSRLPEGSKGPLKPNSEAQ